MGHRPARRRRRLQHRPRHQHALGLDDVPGVTVNRYCSSSLQTIRMAFHAIKAGEGDCFIAGGVETVSRYMSGERFGPEPDLQGARRAHQAPRPGWPGSLDPAGRPARHVHRDGPDRRTWSRPRASAAKSRTASASQPEPRCEFIEKGFLRAGDHAPRADGTVVSKDDGPRPGTTYRGREPAEAGVPPRRHRHRRQRVRSTTAPPPCVMSDTKARSSVSLPLARIVSSGVSGLNPEIMGLGPIEAIRKALALAGKTIDEIDLVEINEAFAVQVIGSAKHLGIDLDTQMNVHGGAIALGHPFGMTGACIMTTLINGLQWEDKTWGVESMCVGGGQGMAMVIERLS
ncbi:MAG: beta-ketoacyl synthase N-terminal-like domain-containing protein [Ilumatobacteraceae bacterium]